MTLKLLIMVALVVFGNQASAQPRLPTKTEISTFKKLAAKSVLHVETSLKKIEREGPTGDLGQRRREVLLPAAELLKEWRSFGLSDAVMMSYSACQGILGDTQVYGEESLRPPQYHLSDMAQQKLKFIKEDLAECRKLRSQTPDFQFAR